MTETIDHHVLEQYNISKKVGQGAYGVVWKATHRQSGDTVALKKCVSRSKSIDLFRFTQTLTILFAPQFDAFRNNTDSQRTFREVAYLKAMIGHENIINIRNVIRAYGDRDLYITFDYLDTDLSHVIKARILTVSS